MTEVQQATTLRDLARDPESCGMTGIIGEHDVVVLGYSNNGWIEVCRDHAISSWEPGTAVMPLVEPTRQAAVLHSALAAVRSREAGTLADIRSYAIDRHLEGSICEEGLNAFLRAFDLDEFEG